MPKEVLQALVKGVMPTPNGCAVFLGTNDKTFVITVDQYIGNAITMAINDARRERPLTHDLIMHIFSGLNVEVERVVINDVNESIFYARLLLKMENELGKKIVEIDSRPSDCIALAVQSKRPIFVARKVLDAVEDMTEVLERILKEQQ